LIDAIKFVYASTYTEKARQYRQLTGHKDEDEKMAVIIQETVGKRFANRFYPELSGVMRSYNYYAMKPAAPTDGVISLALGLGKTIVDGGVSWSYSPAYPMVEPPFVSVDKLMEATQTKFWSVNMGELNGYEPFKETEYMTQESIAEADEDGSLYHLVSTYDPESERLMPGMGMKGARALTFAPLLVLKTLPFNDLIGRVLKICEKSTGLAVEAEFAMTFHPNRFSLLQVRPMTVPSAEVHLTDKDLSGEDVLASAEIILGNGSVDNIRDIVFVKPETFDIMATDKVVPELVQMNRMLLDQGKPYLLIVYGRLGTTDPWTGISINWEQVAGAKVIVEATRDDVKVELSQGSHYFLNLINLGVKYFTLPAGSPHKVDWDWLSRQPVKNETTFLKHVELKKPLHILADGLSSKGVIKKP
jgi:phosphoenolpyruvate synthase/pyruvate phosphate dikinase